VIIPKCSTLRAMLTDITQLVRDLPMMRPVHINLRPLLTSIAKSCFGQVVMSIIILEKEQ
jgi:hypothetical protein